jgi:hypothetical protein
MRIAFLLPREGEKVAAQRPDEGAYRSVSRAREPLLQLIPLSVSFADTFSLSRARRERVA